MATDRNLIRTMIVSFTSSVIAAVSAIVYTGISTADNNRQWCELLTTLDSAYSSQAPTTELGKTVANAIHRLHDQFGCEE